MYKTVGKYYAQHWTIHMPVLNVFFMDPICHLTTHAAIWSVAANGGLKLISDEQLIKNATNSVVPHHQSISW